jgi:alanine racemase
MDRLKSVLSLKARIGSVRALPAGHTISYGATHTLRRPSRLATVLIGYGDGYPRALSNLGEVIVHGRRAPIIGRVCMDQIVVDVTELPEPIGAGDVCTCIGTDGRESITAESIAQAIQTTEHEITTALTSRLPRIYSNTQSFSS